MELFYDIEENQLGSIFSPDGNWLAYTSGPQGQGHIHVLPFPATGALYQGQGAKRKGQVAFRASPSLILVFCLERVRASKLLLEMSTG